jgi:uncharacterized membrane protein
MEQTAPNSQNQNKEKNTLMAVVAYILFFIPLLTNAKDDPFVKYHVKQGLVLFICAAILMVVESIFIFRLFTPLFNLVIFIFIILGIINAAGGKTIPLPIIGKFADKFTF